MDDASDAELNDQHVAELIFDGKEQGICLLLQRYGARMGFLLKQQFSPTLAAEDIKEVLAFAAMKAFRSAHTFDGTKGRLGGWFYAIAHNTAIDFIREAGQMHQETLPLEYDPAIDARVPAELEDDPSPEQTQTIANLEDAITLLPRMMQAIVRADLAAGGRADDEWLATKLQTTVNSIRVQRCGAHKTIDKIMTRNGTRPGVKAGALK